MITSGKFDPSKVEPWEISPSGEVRRVARPRANLNARQERFVLEYLNLRNGTKAAIAAGYAQSSAAVQAHRLLKHATVREKIGAQQKRVQQTNEVLINKTLRGLASIAFSDPILFLDAEGRPLPLNKMPKEARDSLRRVKVQVSAKGGTRIVCIEVAEKMPALTILAKHLGMLP